MHKSFYKKQKMNSKNKKIIKDLSNTYGDKKIYIKVNNKQYLLRLFDKDEYKKHQGEEEYNYEFQYHYLKKIHKKTRFVPTPLKLLTLNKYHSYAILLKWIKGVTLDKVIHKFNKNKQRDLARKTAKLLKIINHSVLQRKIKTSILIKYIKDRLNRIKTLKKEILKTNNNQEIKLFHLLSSYFNKYKIYLYFQPYVFSHGDYHLCNLVYFRNQIYAIDFNRSTFECLYQDLIKLYFFDNYFNNYFVKKTIHFYFNKNNNKNTWKKFKFLNVMFCLTSWQWAYAHKNNKELYKDFFNLIMNVVNDYEQFKLLIPKSLK